MQKIDIPNTRNDKTIAILLIFSPACHVRRHAIKIPDRKCFGKRICSFGEKQFGHGTCDAGHGVCPVSSFKFPASLFSYGTSERRPQALRSEELRAPPHQTSWAERPLPSVLLLSARSKRSSMPSFGVMASAVQGMDASSV